MVARSPLAKRRGKFQSQLDLGLRVSEPRIETVFSEKMVWLLLESKLQHVIKFRHIYIQIYSIYIHISMDPSTV